MKLNYTLSLEFSEYDKKYIVTIGFSKLSFYILTSY